MSFRSDIDRFMKNDVDGGMLKKVTEIEKYVYKELVQRAARAEGTFSANMNRDKGAPSGKFDKNKTSSIQGRSPVDDPYATYYVSNSAPYAMRLEYGWPLSANSKRKDIRWTDKQPLGLFNVVANAAKAKFK
jgi:hypothetical protein